MTEETLNSTDRSRMVAELAAQIRRACEPRPGEAGYGLRYCAGCGQQYVKPSSKKSRRCPDCSARRLIERNAQLIAKNGPLWEATVMACYVSWMAELDRLGLQPPDPT